jgi:hypothetical protein
MKLLKLAAMLASLIAGCMSPVITDDDGGDETDLVKPDPLLGEAFPTVAVSASPDAFAEISGWLGKSNTITVANATTIDRDAVTVNVPAGATVSYQFSEELGTFTFAKPLPSVTAKVLGWKVSPSLSVVTLRPSGDGSAKTSLGTYRFKWLAEDDDAGSAAADEKLPEVWCYSQPGCPPCVRARLELAAEKDLPFRIVWKDEAAPAWLTSRPAFWWHVSGQQPNQADVKNTRQVTGWNGVKDFSARWKASRAVSSYHAGHECPSCGRTQYAIANNAGPNHTHRCGSCNVTWWHADQ